MLAGAACTDTESSTNLHTSGPPTIEQVRVKEDQGGGLNQAVFGFGWFPGVTDDVAHHVTAASATNQKLRIIMGKLLVGNYLEQVQCTQPVRIDYDGMPTAYDIVPIGATPDDIAKCTESDVVAQTCHGALATCICQLDAGCGTGLPVDKGTAVGIKDVNHDGAADLMRFAPNAVTFHCHGDTSNDEIDIPPDLTTSYWNPSGFQQAPASCGHPNCYDDIGPAIVLQPIPVGTPGTAMMPTSSTCGLVFSSDVVDKSEQQVCAAPNGRPPECDNVNLDQCKLDQDCMPGDVSAFKFTTEPLVAQIQDFADNDIDVSRTNAVTVTTVNAVPLDPGSITNFTVQEVTATGPVAYNQYTVTFPQSNVIKINWTATGGLAANTQYIITFKKTFADFYHQGLPAEIVYHFTTGA